MVEAKNNESTNVIIRQLYYPFRQWKKHTNKKIATLFFTKSKDFETYSIWQFDFDDANDYNSIKLIKSESFQIMEEQEF